MHLYTKRLKVKKGGVYNNFYFYHKLLSARKVAFVTTFLLGGVAVAGRSCCGLLQYFKKSAGIYNWIEICGYLCVLGDKKIPQQAFYLKQRKF
ncbi:Uncharacterized protein APZ42_012924 [Daphnia magna]|uniref:Uncharacterized protein n=1 Tax=Daphnia magna TaxID=35525 RepID=A0A162RCD9_9CRUS|nr:Uncharacterized protein APZ42_012924 [Daphnia magna]